MTRVAMMSVGLGRVQRGFERLLYDLFTTVRDEVDVTMFKSGGPRRDDERVPRGLKPATAVARRLPLGRWGGSAEYHRDCIAFGLVMLPYLLRGRFDVVHCIDPPMATVLARLRSAGRHRWRLLFTEASAMPPRYYPRVDHVHHIAPWAYDDAIASGIPADHMTMIPSGMHPERFRIAAGRAELRRRHAVPDDAFVILSISAVNRHHKRVDHLIEEVSRLEGGVLLWIDGNPEDPGLVDFARRTLGDRCRITHVPSAEIPELYGLADVMVQTSLTEAFGIALIEALGTGLFVLAHDAPHFRWLVDDRDCLVDMSADGALAARLRELRGRRETLADPDRGARARRRFDWLALKPDYLDLYRRVAAARPGPGR